MNRFGLILSLGALAVLSACGPVSLDQAERTCLDDARLAERPRGNVALGIGGGNGGTRAIGRVEMDISSDYLRGRDPSEVYQSCVVRRSGQLPRTSYADQPRWPG